MTMKKGFVTALMTVWLCSARPVSHCAAGTANSGAGSSGADWRGTVGKGRTYGGRAGLCKARRFDDYDHCGHQCQGAYSFPRARLEAGRYGVSIRAVGYVLDAPASRIPVNVTASNAVQLNMNLRESNPLELAIQLTDPEWLSSFPITEEQKFELRDCSRCHTLQRVAMSMYNKDQMAWVVKRMVYSAGSSPMTYQLPAALVATWGRAEWGDPTAAHKRQAEAVAAINLSEGMWKYELKKFPRPKGKATQVVYTTYDLPVTHRPHDTRIGLDGAIWYNHFNDNALARLDTKTGQTKEWRWPYRAAQGSYEPTGARTMMGPDSKGRFYIGNQAQDGLVVFDPSTEKFTYSSVPEAAK